jgi:hypothetical protein
MDFRGVVHRVRFQVQLLLERRTNRMGNPKKCAHPQEQRRDELALQCDKLFFWRMARQATWPRLGTSCETRRISHFRSLVAVRSLDWFPGAVGVEASYRQRRLAGNGGNILLIDNAILIHDEGVNSGHFIFGRPR